MHITIGTLNTYGPGAVFNEQKRRTFQARIRDLDVLCVQEANDNVKRLSEHETVDYFESQAGYEDVAILRKKQSPWILNTDSVKRVVEKKDNNDNNCNTDRFGNFIKVSHQGVEIKIANVHLCGGRFDERVHQQHDIENMKNAKMNLLREVFVLEPDVICGDFNSDAKGANAEYLKNLGWRDEQIEVWNNIPFDELKKQGYELVILDEPTSVFGGYPDAIAYKIKKFKLIGKKRIDMGMKEQEYSDHDGIAATFEVLSTEANCFANDGSVAREKDTPRVVSSNEVWIVYGSRGADTIDDHKAIAKNVRKILSDDYDVVSMSKEDFVTTRSPPGAIFFLADHMQDSMEDDVSCEEVLNLLQKFESQGVLSMPSVGNILFEQNKLEYMETFKEFISPYVAKQVTTKITKKDIEEMLEKPIFENVEKFMLKGTPGFGAGQVKSFFRKNIQEAVNFVNNEIFNDIDSFFIQKFHATLSPSSDTEFDESNTKGEYHAYYRFSDGKMKLWYIVRTQFKNVGNRLTDPHEKDPNRFFRAQMLPTVTRVVEKFTSECGFAPWFRIDVFYDEEKCYVNEITRINPGFYVNYGITGLLTLASNDKLHPNRSQAAESLAEFIRFHALYRKQIDGNAGIESDFVRRLRRLVLIK